MPLHTVKRETLGYFYCLYFPLQHHKGIITRLKPLSKNFLNFKKGNRRIKRLFLFLGSSVTRHRLEANSMKEDLQRPGTQCLKPLKSEKYVKKYQFANQYRVALDVSNFGQKVVPSRGHHW